MPDALVGLICFVNEEAPDEWGTKGGRRGRKGPLFVPLSSPSSTVRPRRPPFVPNQISWPVGSSRHLTRVLTYMLTQMLQKTSKNIENDKLVTSQRHIEQQALQNTTRLERASEALVQLHKSSQGPTAHRWIPDFYRAPYSSIRLPSGSIGLSRAKGLHRTPESLAWGSIGLQLCSVGPPAPILLHGAPSGSTRLHAPGGSRRFPWGPVGGAPMRLGSPPEPGLLRCAWVL